jgi:hypothetical protein
MIIFGAALVVLYLVFWAWHSPWAGKLSKAEIDRYLAIIERSLQPAEEVEAFTSRVRSWAEADDGRPVYMVNLMHFLPQFRTFPGAPEFKGTPREANAYYEKGIKWLWLRRAAYPIFSGVPQARNLIHIQPERTWAETAVVRYRNRRTFLRLLSDPSYAATEPYKFIAVEIDLVPISSKMVIPDPRLVVGVGFVIIFLLVGWISTV